MPTDVPALKAKLLAERQAVVDELAVIDVPAELALFNTAAAALQAAQATFENKSRRWTLVNEKQERLAVLDAQIALFP